MRESCKVGKIDFRGFADWRRSVPRTEACMCATVSFFVTMRDAPVTVRAMPTLPMVAALQSPCKLLTPAHLIPTSLLPHMYCTLVLRYQL